MRRRCLVLLFPWPALRSLRLHVLNGDAPWRDARGWDHGYDRAWYEVGENLGIERPSPSPEEPKDG